VTYLALCMSMLITGTFAISAISKLRSRSAFAGFAAAVREMTGMPARTARAVAACVAVLEIAVALTSALPGTDRAGLATAVFLLTIFTALLLRTVTSGRSVPCNCFGASSTPASVRHVVRNLILIVAAATGLVLGPPFGHAHLPAVAVLVCAAAIVVPVAVVALLDDLAELFDPT
jgi:hypothetical protein